MLFNRFAEKHTSGLHTKKIGQLKGECDYANLNPTMGANAPNKQTSQTLI